MVGCLGAATAIALSPDAARAAAAQDWPPFVLVSGLLLVGLVAEEDGLFAAAGAWFARLAPNGFLLYGGAAVLVAAVTTVLNLDTSVAFLTPVLVYTARQRGQGEVALLLACLLLSNAGSLLLPGSNLTNLIVLGHLHLSGADFFRHMAPAWLASVVVTAVVIGVAERHSLRASITVGGKVQRPVLGIGLIAVLAVTVLVLVLHSPALPVAAVGLVSVSLRARSRTEQGERALDVLGVPVLIGLFGIAVALGTLGRVWSGPTASAVPPRHLGHRSRGGRHQRAGEQPPGCVAPGGSYATASVCPSGRAQHRPKPVRDGVARVGAVAASGEVGWCGAVGRKSQPTGCHRCAPCDGCCAGHAHYRRINAGERRRSVGVNGTQGPGTRERRSR